MVTCVHIISERRRETQRASFYSHVGKQNNIITREILILAMWFRDQKVIISRCRTDIRDEPVRPDPTLPGPAVRLFEGLFHRCVKRYELETLT